MNSAGDVMKKFFEQWKKMQTEAEEPVVTNTNEQPTEAERAQRVPLSLLQKKLTLKGKVFNR